MKLVESMTTGLLETKLIDELLDVDCNLLLSENISIYEAPQSEVVWEKVTNCARSKVSVNCVVDVVRR